MCLEEVEEEHPMDQENGMNPSCCPPHHHPAVASFLLVPSVKK